MKIEKTTRYVRTTLTIRKDILEKIEKLIGADLKFVKLSPVVNTILERGIVVVENSQKKLTSTKEDGENRELV